MGYRTLAALSRALPPGVGERAAAGLGAALWPALGGRARMVRRHMARVLGPGAPPAEVDRLARRAVASYARYWVESFRLPRVSPAELDAGLTYEGYEHVQRGLDAGRGVILVLPHLGGWEWAGFWLARVRAMPVTVVVEPLEPPELFEWFRAFRERLGMRVVPLGPRAGAAVTAALGRNEIVCLLADRDLTGAGVEVPFFGEVTTLPAGPATLALRTGAPLLPTAVYFREPSGHHGVVRPPVPVERTGGRLRDDVTRITRAVAAELEALIRAAPDQWHLLQPNWPSDHDATPRGRSSHPPVGPAAGHRTGGADGSDGRAGEEGGGT